MTPNLIAIQLERDLIWISFAKVCLKSDADYFEKSIIYT